MMVIRELIRVWVGKIMRIIYLELHKWLELDVNNAHYLHRSLDLSLPMRARAHPFLDSARNNNDGIVAGPYFVDYKLSRLIRINATLLLVLIALVLHVLWLFFVLTCNFCKMQLWSQLSSSTSTHLLRVLFRTSRLARMFAT
jgi:hypothetical protein